jgi:hypothetical protein
MSGMKGMSLGYSNKLIVLVLAEEVPVRRRITKDKITLHYTYSSYHSISYMGLYSDDDPVLFFIGN